MFMSRCINFFRSLARDTGGASIVFVAASIVPLVAFIGFGTDTARGYLVKARLSQALDAAGLAGAQNASDATLLNQDIQMYFNSNYPSGFLGSTTTGPTYTYDDVNDKLIVTASATVPTTFMRVLGFKDMTVSATTEVTRKTSYLDVVLAMDMSTSMTFSAGGGLTRLEACQQSALTLVGILYGTAESKPLLKMGLVPWTGKVKVWIEGQPYTGSSPEAISPAYQNPLTGVSGLTQIWKANNSPVPLLSAPPANWKGCVYARYINDGNPDTNADIVEYYLDTPAGQWVGWEPIGDEGEPQSPGTCSSGGGNECTPCPTRGITPLNQSKTTITNAINALSPGGYTDIPQGLAWAWRVLTPEAPFEEAELNPDGERVQAIVLLTDGQNWAYYGDAYKSVWGTGTPKAEMDARLLALAANIKAKGVLIYVVQFAENDPDLKNLLKQVATQPASPYYFFAPDPSSLNVAFTEIANHLSELRLSK
jgi:Flp pilus assembly protein TadG